MCVPEVPTTTPAPTTTTTTGPTTTGTPTYMYTTADNWGVISGGDCGIEIGPCHHLTAWPNVLLLNADR